MGKKKWANVLWGNVCGILYQTRLYNSCESQNFVKQPLLGDVTTFLRILEDREHKKNMWSSEHELWLCASETKYNQLQNRDLLKKTPTYLHHNFW
jgi:hypothetical protein